MGRCFVIQPFDKDTFDKRYKDVFVPAIQNAGLEPYRVDEDPKVDIPIETIEKEIQNAEVCLAEITTDNPNVWYEVGFAFATGRGVALICSEERQSRLPFDTQHRAVIKYGAGSPSDFATLGRKITDRLKALVAKNIEFKRVATLSPLKPTTGLAPQEIAVLVAIAQNQLTPGSLVYQHVVVQEMDRMGYNALASALALHSLREKQWIEYATGTDDEGSEFQGYCVKTVGMTWLMANQGSLVLRKEDNRSQSGQSPVPF